MSLCGIILSETIIVNEKLLCSSLHHDVSFHSDIEGVCVATKNVFVVLVKNKDEDTTKAELARQNSIPVMLVDDFIKKYKLDL